MENLPSWCRVGARVVCVDAGPLRSTDGRVYEAPELTEGCVYVVERIEAAGLHLQGVRIGGVNSSGGYFAGFNRRRFRPVRDTSIESLRALLNPTPDEIADLLEEDALS